MALAALRNRIMVEDGSLKRWKSPDGTKLSLAAAAPEIPWTDLAYSLLRTAARSTTWRTRVTWGPEATPRSAL